MKTLYLYIFLTLIICTSCDIDSFDQVVDIEVPEHTKQLAVTANFAPNDTVLWVYVTHTLGILDNANATPILDAKVDLFKNDALIRTFEYTFDPPFNNLNGFYISDDEALGNSLDNYRLEVDAPSYGKASATQTMPTAVEIKTVVVEEEGTVDPGGEKFDNYILEFQDTPDQNNYYELTAFREFQGSVDLNPVYLETNDPIINGNVSSNEGLIFQDLAFDGINYKLGVYSYNLNDVQPGEKVRFVLRSLTKDDFFYKVSTATYENADGNPFAEPVIIHSNMNGAQGIFSLYSESIKEIEF